MFYCYSRSGPLNLNHPKPPQSTHYHTLAGMYDTIFRSLYRHEVFRVPVACKVLIVVTFDNSFSVC